MTLNYKELKKEFLKKQKESDRKKEYVNVAKALKLKQKRG